MARIVKSLTDSKIRNPKLSPEEYNLPDGNGPHLRVKPSGSKTLIHNYKRPHDGKRTNLGLGVYPSTSLVIARALRDKFRAKISLGANPKAWPQKMAGITGVSSAICASFLKGPITCLWRVTCGSQLLSICLRSAIGGGRLLKIPPHPIPKSGNNKMRRDISY